MTVYVAEIKGRGIAAFHADNGAEAERLMRDRVFRDDLMVLASKAGRAPACDQRSVTCGQSYLAWCWLQPPASAWQPLFWRTVNIWRG